MALDSNHSPSEGRSDPAISPRLTELPADLITPRLYDLVVWGFTERNDAGEWILRKDLQAHFGSPSDQLRNQEESSESALYVGYRCQACWEAAVTLVAYGRHLCPRGDEPVLGFVGRRLL